MRDDCLVCDREAGRVDPIGGWVLRERHWTACVGAGLEVPGWLFVAVRRHVEGGLPQLTREEATDLGPVLVRLATALESFTGAARIYTVAFGEQFPHYHLVLQPRAPGAPADERGPSLFLQRERLLDPVRAASTAAAVRELLDPAAGMTAGEHAVATLDQIPANRGLEVEVAGRTLALFLVDGEVHAIGGICRHMGGHLAEGETYKGVVVCPRHGWVYDLATGERRLTTRTTRGVSRYATRVDGGVVKVRIEDDAFGLGAMHTNREKAT